MTGLNHTRRRIFSVAGTVAVVAAGFFAIAASAGETSGFRADVRSSGTAASMTLAAYCGGGCVETAEAPEAEIRVLRDKRLRVELSDRARRAHGDLVRLEGARIVEQFPGKERARAVEGSEGRAWTFRFDRLHDANAVLFRAYHRPGRAELDNGTDVDLAVWSVRIATR